MTRSRVDHTGLNSTLFLMGNRNNENCDNWGLKKTLSMSYWTVFYMRRKDGCSKIGSRSECNLTGILGSEGEGEGNGLFKFLNYTGLMRRIWAVKRTWCYTLLYSRWRYAPTSCLQSASNQETKKKTLISFCRCVWLGLELNTPGPKLPIPALVGKLPVYVSSLLHKYL